MDDATRIRIERLGKWQAGETVGPVEMTVMPTIRCNLRCSICWERRAEEEFGSAMHDGVDEIPDERWLALVDEAAAMGVREWTIVGGGEPLMRGDLVMRMCERVLERGMSGTLHTNGTMLTADRTDRLIRIGWPRVVVSLDGPDRKTNDRIRSKGSFELATKNLRALSTARAKHGSDLPAAMLNVVVTNANYGMLDQMVELAHEMGASALGFASLIDEGGASTRLLLNDEQEKALPAQLEKARQCGEQLGVEVCTFGQAGDKNGPLLAASGHGCTGGVRMGEARCFEVWLATAVTSDGRVGPCCVSWEEEAGSIRDRPLEEVWFGPYFQRIRKQILSDDPMSYCRKCPVSLIARSEALRHFVRWQETGALARASYLARRFTFNLRGQGPFKTAQRTWQWVRNAIASR